MEGQIEDFSLGLANQLHEERREKYSFFPSQEENITREGMGDELLKKTVYLNDYNSVAKLTNCSKINYGLNGFIRYKISVLTCVKSKA